MFVFCDLQFNFFSIEYILLKEKELKRDGFSKEKHLFYIKDVVSLIPK